MPSAGTCEAGTTLRALLISDEVAAEGWIRHLAAEPGEAGITIRTVARGGEAGTAAYDVVLYDGGSVAAADVVAEVGARGWTAPVVCLEPGDAVSAWELPRGVSARIYPSLCDRASVLARLHQLVAGHRPQAGADLRDAVHKLSQALQHSSELVTITNREGIIEYVNPAFELTTGYSRGEVIGRTPALLNSRLQSPELYRNLWQTILAKQTFHGVLADRRKNGEVFYIEKTITPVCSAQGEITHFISNDRDITSTRTLEQQLQQAQKMDAIGRLAGGVAHDFNNLLMVIGASAELALDGLSAQHPVRNRLEEIQGAARRAATLTRQLLGFSRRQPQVLQVLDLNRVLLDISRLLPRLVGEDVEVQVVPRENLASIRADVGQIEQIVMNLAANARDAMPGGGKLLIETAQASLDRSYGVRHGAEVPPGLYVVLSVSDTGTGIPAEHIGHIFEPFYTTKNRGEGTGLGLATVYGIVKQSGGFVWVYSEPGLGTTFKVYFPAAGGAARETPAPSEGKPQGGNETLLLVEDEGAVRAAVRDFLVASGYRVLEAGNGEQALKVAAGHEGRIHLLISDVVMPHLSGGKLAQLLTASRPGMRVLFVSGYSEKSVLQHVAPEGVASFLQKPFGLSALAAKVREVLDGTAARVVAAST